MRKIKRIIRLLALIGVYVLSAYSYMFAKGFVYNGERFELSNVANASTSTSLSIPVDAQIKISSQLNRAFGSEQAPLTMYSYSSFDCSHCEDFHRFIYPKIERDFVKTNKLRFVFISLPSTPISMQATKLLYCAPSDKYHNFVNQLFQKKNWRFASDNKLLNKEASLIGMSENDIIKCNNDKKLTSDILLMRENAINEIGIKSTPSFIIEGKSGKELIVGARKYEDIKEYLEKRIKENR